MNYLVIELLRLIVTILCRIEAVSLDERNKLQNKIALIDNCK